MTKKTKAEITAKFPVNINEVYPSLFKTRTLAICRLVRNFKSDKDFISISNGTCKIKHNPAFTFLLTRECAEQLEMMGGGL